jgi:hypothetical protein
MVTWSKLYIAISTVVMVKNLNLINSLSLPEMEPIWIFDDRYRYTEQKGTLEDYFWNEIETLKKVS